MRTSNIAVKQFLSDKNRFADLFNGTVFRGQQIVLPEELEERDGESSEIITDKNKKGACKNTGISQCIGRRVQI